MKTVSWLKETRNIKQTCTNDVSFVPVLGAKARLPSQLSFSGMVAELLARNQQKCSHHMLGMRQSLVNLHFLERGRGGCAKAVDRTAGQSDSRTDFPRYRLS
ncbi:hypothetical protein L208DRAFT_1399450, partial [Tricholoma matsutake]